MLKLLGIAAKSPWLWGAVAAGATATAAILFAGGAALVNIGGSLREAQVYAQRLLWEKEQITVNSRIDRATSYSDAEVQMKLQEIERKWSTTPPAQR